MLLVCGIEHDDALGRAAGDANPSTGTRISWPPSVTSMISSLSSTGNEATSAPLRSLTAMATTPLPPRPVTRYSNDEVRLP